MASADKIDTAAVSQEDFTEIVKVDGSKWFICKQCEKESKTEQGIKCHLSSKHNRRALKRTNPGDNSKLRKFFK